MLDVLWVMGCAFLGFGLFCAVLSFVLWATEDD